MSRSRIRQIILIGVAIGALATNLNAQTDRRPVFLGINPSVTVEPEYQKGELDVNVFPLVVQLPLSNRVDVRFTTLLNLGVRKGGNAISHVGIETALPLFFKRKESRSEPSKGFFVAPVLGLTRNRLAGHNNVGLWLEPGYSLVFESRFAFSFGLQVGATHFKYDDGATRWGNHFGVKVVFGRWL